MGTINDIGQKIKGKTQKAQGEILEEQGEGIKGGIKKIKGEFNDKMADAKMNTRANTNKNDLDDDEDAAA